MTQDSPNDIADGTTPRSTADPFDAALTTFGVWVSLVNLGAHVLRHGSDDHPAPSP